jgi:hypothetical protein
MKQRFTLLVFIAGPLLLLLGAFVVIVLNGYSNITEYDMDVFDFETCVAAGYPVMESFPRQCRTNDNRLFVENLYPNA